MAEPRVLQVLGPSAGGIRAHVGQLARSLDAKGWVVEVAGPAGVMGDAGRQHHSLPVPGTPGLAALRSRRQLRSLAARFDLVHAHGLKAGWLAATMGRHAPPVVLTVHNLVLDEVAGVMAAPLRVAEGRLPSRVARTIAVSQAIADRFGGPSSRIRVIAPAAPRVVIQRSAADIRAELGVGDAPFVVSVARLHPQKDIPTLLAATRFLLEKQPRVRVAIVGDGPLAAELAAEVRERRLEKTVLLTGRREDAVDLMAAGDVVVVSSRWEGSPIVVVEALKLGRPLVSTPVGTVPEVVTSGETGVLVPVGDAEAMSAALAQVLADPAWAKRLGDAGQARARELYDPERLVAEVSDVYREALSR